MSNLKTISAGQVMPGHHASVFGFKRPGDWQHVTGSFLSGVVETFRIDSGEFLPVLITFEDGTKVYAKLYAVAYVVLDTTSSASRQHYIETGEYLPIGETLEV
jgi:hypothetical protein